MTKLQKALRALLLLLLLQPLAAESKIRVTIDREHLPKIEEVHWRNLLFREFLEDREQAEMKIARGEQAIPFFYRYQAKKGDTLLTLSARLNLSMEALATANGLTSPDMELTGTELILPTVPGLFLPEKAESAYEFMLQNSHVPKDDSIYYVINGRNCVFLKNERFNPTERAFFLDTTMRLPLSQHVLTSSFGYRVSPISGAWKFHSGVDLAAKSGSPVYACKTGVVTTAGNDRVLGNYVLVTHAGELTSLYAHLSKITVQQGQSVGGGMKIGEVGTTGASTGPHLHFEIRLRGKPTDPGKLLLVD